MPTRYYITLPQPDLARIGGDFGFRSHGAEGFAEELQAALEGGVRGEEGQDRGGGVEVGLEVGC